MKTNQDTKREMTVFFKTVLVSVKTFFSVILFLATIPVIFYFCYLFGHRILEGGMLGGDTPYHLAWIHTLSRFYPKIPMWFPFAGTGSSIVLGYWVFPYYLAIIGSHLSSLTLEQVVRLLEFLSVPLVCLEIYLYLWVRVKNQVMATLGAFLYPLSSMAWGWVAHAGFYAMQLSTALVLPAFLFFDLYLETELVEPVKAAKKRLYLLGYFFFMGLGIFIHGGLMPNLFFGLPLYALLRSQLFPRKKEKRIVSFLRAIKVLMIVIVVGLLAGAFILLPQKQYFSLQSFVSTYGAEDTPYLPWRGFLGFERLSGRVGSLYTPLFLSLLVSVFGLIGIFWGLVKKQFMAALGLTALFYVWWLSSAQVLAIKFPFLQVFLLPTATRASFIVVIYLTILAAYGLWSLADLPGMVIKLGGRFLGRTGKAGKLAELSLSGVSFLLTSVLAVILTIWAFYHFRSWQIYPPDKGEWGVVEAYRGYGTLGMPIPLCQVPGWEAEVSGKKESGEKNTCQDYMPKGVIDEANPDMWPEPLTKAVEALNLGQFTRVSVSPFLGGVIFSFAKHSQASLTSTPAGQSNVNLDWLAIHDRALFQKGDASAKEVLEMAKWWGVKYVFLPAGSEKELLDRYPEDLWLWATQPDGTIIREFKETPGLAGLSSKPAVLVIGSEKKQSYIVVFQVAVKGGISFDQALLVEGKPNIDDYSLEELKQFSALILRGYSYHHRQKAWGLLKEFVENGGGLFIDTGWQFVDQDWGKGPDREGKFFEVVLPEPSPVKKTLWGEIGRSWEGASLSTEIGRGLKLAEFGTPAWGEKAWGMALAKREDLLPWAEPVLAAGDKVIIARGNFGQGKVVWSGMNLFSHAYDKKSQEELRLINNIFNYLLSSQGIEEGGVMVKRDFPDRLEFSLNQVPERPSFLYWAETFTPGWRAYLLKNGQRERLRIYQAGPGFKAVPVAELSGGEKVVMEYSLKKIFFISFGITLATFLVLLVLFFDALVLGQALEKKLKVRLFGQYSFAFEDLAKSLKRKISAAVRWNEED